MVPDILVPVNGLTWVAPAMVLMLAPPSARAESADELVAQGQELAREGRIGDALARFRAADAAEPRAVHSCLIGLAYLRGAALGNAELSFAQCHSRAQTEPLPGWVAKEEQELAQQMTASRLGTVALTLDPAIVALSVPALLDGARFPPARTLRLPAGTHRIVGTTDDRRELTATVVVEPRGAHEATLSPSVTDPAPGPTDPVAGTN